MNRTKSLYEQARNIPVAQVAERFGGVLTEKNIGGSQKWRVNNWMIVVSSSGYGWFEVGGHSGAGAIDLVMLIQGCDKRGALNLLLNLPFATPLFFPTSGVVSKRGVSVPLETHQGANQGGVGSLVPEAVCGNWERVKRWLTKTRGLSVKLIDELHSAGDIYADSFANAIFISKSDSVNPSCELRGTGEKKFAGRRGGRGLFELNPVVELAPIAVVESAIDAISLRELGHNGRIISTGGALGSHAIEYIKTLAGPYLAGFDADEPGDGYSAKLNESLPGTKRLRPGLDCKDWNDILLLEISLEDALDI